MKNPFSEMEETLGEEVMDPREVMRALLATVYLECCGDCGSKLRSEEFMNAFRQMLKEMKLCRHLTTKNAA